MSGHPRAVVERMRSEGFIAVGLCILSVRVCVCVCVCVCVHYICDIVM